MKKLILLFVVLPAYLLAQDTKPVKLFSLLHMDKDSVSFYLGKSKGTLFEEYGSGIATKEAFRYTTSRGEYRIIYRNNQSNYVVFYPNVNTKQKFNADELFEGGIFDINNDNQYFMSQCTGRDSQGSIKNVLFYSINYNCEYGAGIQHSITFYGKKSGNVFKVAAY